MKIVNLKTLQTFTLFILYFGISINSNAKNNIILDKENSLLIKEYFSILDYIGDGIWEGFSRVPKPILLITNDIEYLFYHPYPSDDFKKEGFDNILQAEVYKRKRIFNTNMLASFPAVNGVVCIVIGTPQNTNKNVTDWLLSLVHERFHQYQMSQPNYYKNVNALDLSDSDETGMWMLNYPFPYRDKKVIKFYNRFRNALLTVVDNLNSKDFPKHFANYKKVWKRLKKKLTEKDYHYFSLQLWQEGFARHNEYVYAKKLKNYRVSTEVESMDGFIPFEEYAQSQRKRELQNLSHLKLEEQKRLVFYSIGFAEGLILDKLKPSWRNQYLKKPFYIENYYE